MDWIEKVKRVLAEDTYRAQGEPLTSRGLDVAASAMPRLTAEGAAIVRGLWPRAAEGDVLLPTCDARGEVVGVRLWTREGVRLAAPASSGLATTGAVIVSPGLIPWLRGLEGAERPDEVWVAEGEPDWASAFVAAALTPSGAEVIGIYSGAWSPELGARLSEIGRVGILTDRDRAGERYAATVRQSLADSVVCWRWTQEGDINDQWKASQDPDAVAAMCAAGSPMPPAPSGEEGRWAWSDAAGWTESAGWAEARERERAWAAAQAKAADVTAGDAHLERAKKWAQAALERSARDLRAAEGDRVAALKIMAPVASMVAGGALGALEVRQAWTDCYVNAGSDRETRLDRARMVKDVFDYRGRQATTLEEIARSLAAKDEEEGRGKRKTERKVEAVASPAPEREEDAQGNVYAEAIEASAGVGVDVAAWRRSVSTQPWERAPSEMEIAQRVLRWMTPPGAPAPVYDEGKLWRYSLSAGVWAVVSRAEITRIISAWDRAPVGEKDETVKIGSNTAKGTYILACELSDQDGFFGGAARGAALADGFLLVEGKEVKVVAHSPAHRARWSLPFMPSERKSDLLTRYLATAHDGEDAPEKVRLMGEIAFVALTGLGTHFKKAVLCYGQGGSGKSQFLELVGRLVPKSAQCTVEPQQMGQDYHCAFLSGKALNMVTDLNGSDILHEGRFKAIVHGEPVPARQPRGEVYQLQPRALHLFNANALPPAPGATPAFWDRWLVIGFQKGWTGEQRQMLEGGVKDIAAAILATDMGGLLGWAIECGRDLMARGHYTLPKTAGEILGKWRGEGDSVAEWVSEQCERLDAKAPQSRWLEASIAYMNYRDWCKASGYQSVSIRTLKNRLESHGVVTRRASAGSIYAVALKTDKLPPHF